MGKKRRRKKKKNGRGEKAEGSGKVVVPNSEWQLTPQMFFFNFFEHLKVTFEKLNHSLGAQVSCHNIIH